MFALSFWIIVATTHAIAVGNDATVPRTFRRLLSESDSGEISSTMYPEASASAVPTIPFVPGSDEDSDADSADSDDANPGVIVGDKKDPVFTFGDDNDFDIFEDCAEAIEALEAMTQGTVSDVDSSDGDTLLSICSDLDCPIEEVCLTKQAMKKLESNQLTECTCGILVCDAECAVWDAAKDSGNALRTLVAFALGISTLLWL